MDPTLSASFILKKLIGALLMPIPVALILMVLALWWLRHSRLKAGISLVLAMSVLTLSSLPPVADHLIRAHETHYPLFDLQTPVNAVVVLGSKSLEPAEGSPAHMFLASAAMHRLAEALRILDANPQAILIVSGYGGLTGEVPHALRLRDAAISLGVNPERIIAMPDPVDTEDEARLIAPLVKGHPFALVSSASHLRRAVIFFQQQGLAPIAAPSSLPSESVSDWRLSSAALGNTELAIYEWLGLAWQSVKGVFRP